MSAVIFDMDGVVVDSERYWVELEEEQIFPRAVAAGAPSAAEITGMNVRDVYAHFADRYEMAVSETEFVRLYERAAADLYTSKVALLDGFDALLDILETHGCQVALASSSPPDWIEMVLDRFDLHEAFDHVVSAETLSGESKPDPAIYRHTASLLDVQPEDCLAVEDSAHGIHATNAAGMYTVGYRPDHNHQDLSSADSVASTAGELRDRIDSILADRAT